MSELHAVAHKMVEKGKGILAADESTPTCTKRFESISTESTAENRNIYRNMLFTAEKIEKYIIDLIFATRYPEQYGLEDLKPLISFGASPRGSINLTTAAKCYAFIKRRGYVVPEDVRAVVHDVFRHRIGITYEAEAENITSEDIINRIVNVVEVP